MGSGENKEFSCLMHNHIPEFKTLYNGQHFPLYIYQNNENDNNTNLLSGIVEKNIKQNNITDELILDLKKFYKQDIKSEQVFFYIYGILHSEDYRLIFKNNLNKEIPRIPYVKSFKDFIKIENIGKSLSSIHLKFLDVNKYPISIKFLNQSNAKDEDLYRVKKMKHPIFNGKKDLSKIIYNNYITLEKIPLEAYEYKVNEKSAIHWIMDQQSFTQNEDTNIIDDPNDYAINTVKNVNFQIELIQKIITVSLETQKLIKILPALQISN